MKTLFTMGFGQNYFSAVRPVLGQQESLDLNQMRAQMSMADQKMAALNQWIANRPDYQTILGADLARWNGLINAVNQAASNATTVEQRLNSSDASNWYISPSEKTDLYNWMNTIDVLYGITMAHPQLRPSAPAATPGAAQVTQTSGGPSPLVIGAGAAAAVGILALVLR